MTHIPSASVLDQAHLPVAKTAMVLQGTSSVLLDMESTVMVSFCVVTKPRASDKATIMRLTDWSSGVLCPMSHDLKSPPDWKLENGVSP